MSYVPRSLHPTSHEIPSANGCCKRQSIPLIALSLSRLMLLVILLGSVTSLAQSTNGSITGTVSDTSGAAVSHAQVVATDTQRGVSFKDVTNDAGLYRISRSRSKRLVLKPFASLPSNWNWDNWIALTSP